MIYEGKAVDVVCMDFSKSFDKVRHGRLVQKVKSHGIGVIEYKDRQIMLQLYRTLVRPHLEYCIPFWPLHYHKDVDALERVQKMFIRMLSGMGDFSYEDSFEDTSESKVDMRMSPPRHLCGLKKATNFFRDTPDTRGKKGKMENCIEYNELLKQKTQLEELETILKKEQEKMHHEVEKHETMIHKYQKLQNENE
eukprot:g42124.t1